MLYHALHSNADSQQDVSQNKCNGDNGGLGVAPLPLVPPAGENEPSRVYDLYVAHKTSGELDLSREWFLPAADNYNDQHLPFLFPSQDKAVTRWRAAKTSGSLQQSQD